MGQLSRLFIHFQLCHQHGRGLPGTHPQLDPASLLKALFYLALHEKSISELGGIAAQLFYPKLAMLAHSPVFRDVKLGGGDRHSPLPAVRMGLVGNASKSGTFDATAPFEHPSTYFLVRDTNIVDGDL